ncbi:MAG: transcriptional regulator [Candidatus Bathyarchaeia archaeon]|nr:transcriptional regulator [Candidatus Bathyarchaeota archaeon]
MSEVPLSPLGREQIHKLESALLIGSILRPDVLERLRNPEERLTWVDSLAVAAAALARERAKMTISQIAEELGRTEATIRSHLQGRTKAGEIVRETYERIAREGLTIPQIVSSDDLSKLKTELERERRYREKLESVLEDVRSGMARIVSELLPKLVEYNEEITRSVNCIIEKISEVKKS